MGFLASLLVELSADSQGVSWPYSFAKVESETEGLPGGGTDGGAVKLPTEEKDKFPGEVRLKTQERRKAQRAKVD